MLDDFLRDLFRDPSDQPGPRPWRFLLLYVLFLCLLSGLVAAMLGA